jgi:hypothetical protein
VILDGLYQTIPNNNDSVYSFLRYLKNKAVLVAVNFSNTPQNISLDLAESKSKPGGNISSILGKAQARLNGDSIDVSLKPHAVEVWQWKSK